KTYGTQLVCSKSIWAKMLKNSILRFVAIFLLVGFLPSVGVCGDIKPTTSTVLKPGLSAHVFDITGSSGINDLQIIFIESHKTKYAPHLIGGTGRIGSARYSFPATLAEINFDDAPVVISGSYSGRFGGGLQPLGYLKSDGAEISARFHHSWIVDTVFCADPRKSTSLLYSVDPTESIIGDAVARTTFGMYADCVQTGPELFKSGENVIDGRQVIKDEQTDRPDPVERYISTLRIQLFLCKADADPDSPLGIGITTDKVELSQLNKSLPNLTIESRKVCQNVVALSGSGSAGMLINGSLVAGSSSFLVTSAIAFVRNGQK
ncbi:MAG: hypothetical protein ACREQT_07715, partial [Candidatus Binataceae bacterium]